MFSNLNPIPAFPNYRGPLNVGTAEYEIPTSVIPSSSHLPDPETATIKFRIFYPAPSSPKKNWSVTWLPEPQREWLDAYLSFLQAPPNVAKYMSYVPLPFKYTVLPADRNPPLLSNANSGRWPVLVFSHGLGGSCNAYSHLLGSLASCGVICVAPEHRDQSAPVSLIRQVGGESKRVRYKHLPHDTSPEVTSERNAQLRIRLWELELLYSALSELNRGEDLKNLADDHTPNLAHQLDLTPSKVTWAGHSFGAAAVVQFVKSVYWHQAIPTPDGDHPSRPLFQPLYTPPQNSALKEQITPSSPIALLDLWTMPLRGAPTLWLWEQPLPCFAVPGPPKNNVLSIMSEQFYNWTSLLERLKAVLSPDPAAREAAAAACSSDPGHHRDTTTPSSSSSGPRLFYAPKSAHLSQSDFGILFPWPTKRWLRAEEPERTLWFNARAILQLLRENGISVESIGRGEEAVGDEAVVDDAALADAAILARDGKIQGWVPVPID